jgi:fused signal recognition particle receptor
VNDPANAGPAAPAATGAKGWFRRLAAGLTRSSSKLTEGIASILTKRQLDEAMLEQIEELLIEADLGVTMSTLLVQDLRLSRFGKDVTDEEVRIVLAGAVAKALEPVANPLRLEPAHRPHVVLVVGANGSGKTTTIGKLAAQWRADGKKVMLAAGDTFRAAAVQQLRIWGERAGVPVISRPEGADSAALAYDALVEARAAGADVLLIDTAGRLHNKADLMSELAKVKRVMKKLDESAPHSILLVLDATIGQNAHAQVETFRSMIEITGLVVTKLDGSSKGGVLVALAEKFKLPVHAVGVGEGIEDLKPFSADAFARGLMGLPPAA